MDIKIEKKRKISEMIVDELIEQIRLGKLKVGEKLPNERALAESLGVSRMPLREAIHALGQAGLVETRHGEGTFVCPFSSDKLGKIIYWFTLLDNSPLFDLLETGKIIEVESARLACQRATDEELDAIHEAMVEREKFSDISSDDPEGQAKRLEAGDRFHEAIIKASHNTLFLNFRRAFQSSLCMEQKTIFDNPPEYDVSTKIHREIYNAIVAGDEESAASKMQRYLSCAENALRTIK